MNVMFIQNKFSYHILVIHHSIGNWKQINMSTNGDTDDSSKIAIPDNLTHKVYNLKRLCCFTIPKF